MWSGALLVLIIGLSWALQARAAAPSAVGEVIFTIGESRMRGVGAEVPAAVGAKVLVGQTVLTGPNGHVHIRFVDHAFVSVRPNSELRVEDYAFDAQKPEASRVRFVLSGGTARLISGRAGQSAKQNFRVNTPVSAIGIRGTDFVVNTTSELTRVAVYQGAVAVSPFSSSCLAASLGPCSGAMAKDLAGSLSNQFVEVKKDMAAELVVAPAGSAGKIFAPANPKEPSPGVRPNASVQGATPTSGGEASAFQWGRWAQGSAGPVGFEVIASHGGFELFRKVDEIDLPKSGAVSFTLARPEVYARASDGTLTKAEISNPALSIDFAAMKYSTSFKWRTNTDSAMLKNVGSISAEGRFVQSKPLSNMSISGALSGSGDEAAYMFLQRRKGDDAFGILNWKR